MKVLDISKLNMNIPKFEDLEYAFIPSEIYVPLDENSEKLKVGKKIKEGDVLSVLDGGNVHSSIPGIITEIRNNTMPNGKNSKVAVVKMDGAFSYVGKKIVKSEWELFSASHIMDMLKDNGVHNTFFGYKPISSILDKVDLEQENVLGVRLYDYDPSCTTDSFVFEHYKEQVLEGAFILAKSL